MSGCQADHVFVSITHDLIPTRTHPRSVDDDEPVDDDIVHGRLLTIKFDVTQKYHPSSQDPSLKPTLSIPTATSSRSFRLSHHSLLASDADASWSQVRRILSFARAPFPLHNLQCMVAGRDYPLVSSPEPLEDENALASRILDVARRAAERAETVGRRDRTAFVRVALVNEIFIPAAVFKSMVALGEKRYRSTQLRSFVSKVAEHAAKAVSPHLARLLDDVKTAVQCTAPKGDSLDEDYELELLEELSSHASEVFLRALTQRQVRRLVLLSAAARAA